MAQKTSFSLDQISEEILQIADEATAETLNLAKLRIDARKWLASRLSSEIQAAEKNAPPPLLQRIETVLIDPKTNPQNTGKSLKKGKKNEINIKN